ncbi:hypothetical protein PG999_009700 [Apiospora kogelbergensis]|uniref:Uncharacterized protein n=1 Tax=Apiospora kogelbergensis TaxID=1337665 RepID=A0AAW0QTZ5_9PEZI
MSDESLPQQPEADPCQELHDVLHGVANCKRRGFRAALRFGNILPPSSSIQLDAYSSVPQSHADGTDQGEEAPNIGYVTKMDWGSPPRSSRSTLLPSAMAKTLPLVYVEGNLSLPEIPKHRRKLGMPGPAPERTREQRLRQHKGRHDWARIHRFWRLAMTHREVELQLAEKQLAARFNPYNEMVQHVTVAPVERAPSPPPAFPVYPQRHQSRLTNAVTTPRLTLMPLSLIPTERIWTDGGRLDADDNTAGFHGPLTGTCAAAMGIIRGDDGGGGGPTAATVNAICSVPCQADYDPFHGGICESTEHHPSARVWVCDQHDKLGRQEAAYDLQHLALSLRHYACADCCLKIELNGAAWFLGETGRRIFEVQPHFDPAVEALQPTLPTPGLHLARSVTRCACAAKVTGRRLCAPHRLEAVMQLYRWHPAMYQAEMASSVASRSRKNAAVGPSCPLCLVDTPVDHFRFRGPRGREGRTVAWVCKACLGIVTGVVATPAWVAGAVYQDRWVNMGPLTRDYPMYAFGRDPSKEELV